MISQRTIEEDYHIPHERLRIMASEINSFHIDMAIVMTFNTFRASSVRFSLTRLFDIVDDLEEGIELDRYLSRKVRVRLLELITQGKIIIAIENKSNNRNLYRKNNRLNKLALHIY